MTLVQKEIKAVYTWTGKVTDMRGPCPEGYHVPNIDEWVSIYNIWTALGLGASDGASFSSYLKLPFAGNRKYSDCTFNNNGTYGYYWACTMNSSNYPNTASFSSSTITINTLSGGRISNGMPIRPLKDTSVTPDSNWTSIYASGSGGIYHNSSLGLISLSSDGNTWITIADKNLGATTVWNSGDTLSYANCGNYYQRGNNYGFGWEDASLITKSSTQVDAQNYGPGNYYSSSTWVTVQTWDSSSNLNLRGGVTGVLTEHKIRPADTGWQPGPNTRLYLPLNGDSKDPYNNVTYNWAYGSANYSTWSTGIQAANFTGSNAIGLGSSNFFSGQASTVTMSMWFTTTTTESSSHIVALNNQTGGYFLQFNLYGNYIYPLPGSANTQMQSTTQMVIGTKYLVTMTVDVPNGIAKSYINGQLEATRTLSSIGSSSGSQYIGCRRDGGGDYWKGMIREFILEDKVWTADEILAYYNQTK